MKKVLIIPHHPGLFGKIKLRLIEIAKFLSSKYEVYLLNWHAQDDYNYTFSTRISASLKDLFARVRLYKVNELNIIEFPVLHRPLFLIPYFNSFWLSHIIDKYGIDVVINGSYYLFNLPKRRSLRYIFDLADFPFCGDDYFVRFIRQQLLQEFEKADKITVVSETLGKYIWENYHKKTYYLPNGANLKKLRSIDEKRIEAIRDRYGLKDKWVIGYIGLMGEWVDVDFMVEVFRQVKKEDPRTALLLIGPSTYFKKLSRFSGEDIIVTGGIDEEINSYFNCLDLGVLPNKKSLFQDMAFHIKLIEYSAARKIMVSSPLEEVKRLKFPNILLADLNISDWVEAIKKAKAMQWDHDWDKLVEPYDWDNILNGLCNIIEKNEIYKN